MTKVLFLLSAVVMVVAGFFSYQNRDAFVTTRLERQDTDQKISVELTNLTNLADEIQKTKSQTETITAEAALDQSRIEQVKIKLRNAEAEAARAAQEVEVNQKKIAEYKAKITSMPPGVNLETINEDINKLKTIIAENETQAVQMQEQVALKDAEVKKVQNELDSFVRRVEDRRKSFDRNSMSATIVAVNNDWGFVVINGGENKGITPETKLLVTRGSQSIGKLHVVDVEGNRTIANIVGSSVPKGQSVTPGDTVILETLYQ